MAMKMKLPGKNKLSLRVVLILYVVIPLGISLAFAAYMALAVWENQVEQRMKTDLEMVARAIQLPLSHAMERDREGGVEQAVESALSLEDIYSAYVYDEKGEQVASAGKEDPTSEQDKMNELASEGERKGEFGQVGKQRVYSYFVPLKDSKSRVSGLLRLTRREKDFQQYIKKARIYGFGGIGGGLVVMVILVLFGHHQALGRHFHRLTSGMQRIADGETTYRLPKTGPKEIVSVAETFNQMLNSVQGAEAELRRKREKQLELEQQLRQKEKLAAVGQLAAGVAHELGTPLSTISGTAQRGLRREESDSTHSRNYARIRNEVDRMQVIIRELLDFSHSQELQPRNLQPAQVAESAAEAVAEEAKNNGADIAIEGGTDTHAFSGDPVRLEQAVVNLLKNAIQSRHGVNIRIGWFVENERMVYTVDDDGPGIPEEIQPRLFEPFFTTKNVGSGTGLGLAVVHGIVKEHGGSVEAGRSDMGGAQIKLAIPLNTDNTEQAK